MIRVKITDVAMVLLRCIGRRLSGSHRIHRMMALSAFGRGDFGVSDKVIVTVRVVVRVWVRGRARTRARWLVLGLHVDPGHK